MKIAPMLALTFWELNDWVQWYSTSLSLDLGLGLEASGSSWPSSVLPPSLSIAEIGHQLQLVGVTLLAVAMTAGDRRKGDG